jgi:hypothetical protein
MTRALRNAKADGVAGMPGLKPRLTVRKPRPTVRGTAARGVTTVRRAYVGRPQGGVSAPPLGHA